MTRHRQIAKIVALTAFLLSAAASIAAETPFSIRVEVEAKTREDVVVRFQITNTSNTERSLYSAFLPWVSPVATRMVLVPLSGGDPVLDQDPSIEDPTSETMVLRSGETVSGSLSLAKRFSALKTLPADKGAYLFWVINLFGSPDNRVFRIAGHVEIPASPQRRQ